MFFVLRWQAEASGLGAGNMIYIFISYSEIYYEASVLLCSKSERILALLLLSDGVCYPWPTKQTATANSGDDGRRTDVAVNVRALHYNARAWLCAAGALFIS